MKARPSLRWLNLVMGALLCAALGGCSSFDARWRSADAPGKSQAPTRWDGRWTSAKHHASGGGPEGGRLRCVLERAERGKLAAHFHANWLVFASNYSVMLEPKPGAAKSDFRGTHDLPKMFGGTYTYDARITPHRFTARYDSAYDTGTFDLRRVKNER